MWPAPAQRRKQSTSDPSTPTLCLSRPCPCQYTRTHTPQLQAACDDCWQRRWSMPSCHTCLANTHTLLQGDAALNDALTTTLPSHTIPLYPLPLHTRTLNTLIDTWSSASMRVVAGCHSLLLHAWYKQVALGEKISVRKSWCVEAAREPHGQHAWPLSLKSTVTAEGRLMHTQPLHSTVLCHTPQHLHPTRHSVVQHPAPTSSHDTNQALGVRTRHVLTTQCDHGTPEPMYAACTDQLRHWHPGLAQQALRVL